MASQIDEALAKVPFQVTNPELIPAQRYYSEEFFELEREHLWSKVWQMACRLEEIPEVGDYTEYTILDKSVIVVRTATGVKAYQNACRHRGVRLVNGPGQVSDGGFICPFHGWRWNTQGECTFVFGKKIFNDDLLTEDQINLPPVRLEEWAGCAFINFDNDALPLRAGLGPVERKMDVRNADKLKMDWWCGTVLPTNWKLAMEAFMESYHVMATHRQLFDVTPNATLQYGCDHDEQPIHEGVVGKQMVGVLVDFLDKLSEGMGGGMVHQSELAVIERLRDMDVPDDAAGATGAFYSRMWRDVEEDGRKRGAPMFDIPGVSTGQPYHAVEFMFPHFFLLPVVGAMASYRVRPLTPETCLFEIWCLVLRPEGEPFDTPTEPTILPYDSPDFPEIPRQDYSNLPLQQLGLHNLDFMRIGKGANGGDSEGLISNYQRLIDGYIAGLDAETLRQAQNVVNSGFDSTILDIGF